MTVDLKDRIVATCGADEFVGRTAERERLLSHAGGQSSSNGLVLLTAPNTGTSELLRQTYDYLFRAQTGLIPIYFEIKASDVSTRSTALRFIREFLLQTVAFRRNDKTILDASPDIQEISELTVPIDGYWVDRLIETLKGESCVDDDRSLLRSCLSASLRAAGHDARSFVMINSLHVCNELIGGKTFVEDLNSVFARSTTPFVFAGRRRFLFTKTPFETFPVEQFAFTDASKLVESLAARSDVAINDQTRDLIAVQFDGNVGPIAALITSAAEKDASLDSFERVQNVYTEEIFGGRISRYFDRFLDRIAPQKDVQSAVIGLLQESLGAREGKIPIAYWKKHTGLDLAELNKLLTELNVHEIVNIESGVIKFDALDTVMGDYVAGRARLEIDRDPRGLVVGETLAANIRRAPGLMARVYRRRAAIGLRELLKSFDGRMISPALIDYGKFQAELKGEDDENILKRVREDRSKIALPQIVYTAYAAAFYPRLTEIADVERIAVALGFDSEGIKTTVIAAEIDSKLEATLELAEFWCDRLEMAAVHCNLENYRLWLVAPQGFKPDALEALKTRGAHGSSRKQAHLLARVIANGFAPVSETAADEYEITVPMGDDTEMIAAHTIEDIARRHKLPTKMINQIKTALVEACINAAEHSLSPDRKIYQKFAVDNEKVVVTVANRGLRLVDKNAVAVTSDEGRRGWGLKLMKGLMDEVKIERSDDGTRITMVKFTIPQVPTQTLEPTV